MPVWSLAASTVGFAFSVLVVSRSERITARRSTIYNLVIFTMSNAIGILLFGGGNFQAVFQSLAVTGVVTAVFMMIKFTRQILLFFVRNRFGKWIGFIVSGSALASIVISIVGLDLVPVPTLSASLQSELHSLSRSVQELGPQFASAAIVHPYTDNGRAYIYVESGDTGQTLSVPTRAYSSYYDRLVALLTRTPLVPGTLLAGRPGVIRDVLLSNNLLQSSDSPVIVVDGNLNAVNFNAELPSRTIFRSVSTNVTQIQENIGRVLQKPAISSTNTRIINATPADTLGLASLEIDGQWSDWSSVYPAWQNVISRYGFAESAGATAKDALDAVASGSNVLIVVAHSDGNQIFFPDGSRLAVQDFSSFREQIQRDNPLIVLFGCETAKIEGLDSYARGLIDLGASAVVAPTTQIGAVSSSSLLDRFLEHSAAGSPILDALLKAAQDTSIFELQNWIGSTGPIGSFS